MEGADTEAVIAQVEKCPSGAFSFFRNSDADAKPEAIDVETIIEATSNGPLMVYGILKKRFGRQ